MLAEAVDLTIGKYVLKSSGNYRYSMVLLGVGILPMMAYVAAAGAGNMSILDVALSAAAGVISAGAIIIYYRSLELQQETNVAALTEVQPALLFLFGVFVLGETINSIEIAGILAIFIGAAFVMTTRKMRLNMLLVPVIIANALWAVQWVVFDYVIGSYGGYVLPILIGRIISFAFVSAYVLGFRKVDPNVSRYRNMAPAYLILGLMALVGILDGSANILFAIVVKSNIIAIGSVIYATMPIVAALLARIFYRDGLSNIQKAGLVIAVLGAIAIGIG